VLTERWEGGKSKKTEFVPNAVVNPDGGNKLNGKAGSDFAKNTTRGGRNGGKKSKPPSLERPNITSRNCAKGT